MSELDNQCQRIVFSVFSNRKLSNRFTSPGFLKTTKKIKRESDAWRVFTDAPRWCLLPFRLETSSSPFWLPQPPWSVEPNQFIFWEGTTHPQKTSNLFLCVYKSLFCLQTWVWQDYPPNLSILFSGGKENNCDSLSQGRPKRDQLVAESGAQTLWSCGRDAVRG